MKSFDASAIKRWRHARATTPLLCALVSILAFPSSAQAGSSALAKATQDLGVASPSTAIAVTVWVKGNAEAALDAAVTRLYDTESATYHQWLTAPQIAAYGPSAQDVLTLKASLESAGLSTVHSSEDGTMLKVSGTAASMQSAFGTTIHQLRVNGKIAFKAMTAPRFTGTHAELIGAVSGLSGGQAQSFAVRQTNLTTGAAVPAVTPQAGTDPLASFTASCFAADVTMSASQVIPNSVAVHLLSATYKGAGYSYSTTTALPQCGMTAKQVVDHYGIEEAHALGWTGRGQTIVIVDAYGSPNIATDVNTFSQVMHLPSMTSQTLQVVNSAGAPAATDSGWANETTLDVEWAHAVAPDAKIVLVVAPSEDLGDLADAVNYAAQHHLGDVISNSWGLAENLSTLDEARMFNGVFKKAAAQGIAVNVATGDSGDNSQGSPSGAATIPSDSQYATAVGGTTLNLPTDAGVVDAAWGIYTSELATSRSVSLTPSATGFAQGGGGGESMFLVKPPFQRTLPGAGRQTPDISAIADPQTGAIVVETDLDTGNQNYFVVGGTSLSTPIFSAIWALANQAAGESLGQAAPVLGKLPAFAIRDILPVSGKRHNVRGSVTLDGVTTDFAPYQVLGLNPTQRSDFVSALIFASPGPNEHEYVALGFGLDSSLSAAKGWDNATGFGEPNGLLFVDSARYFSRAN